MAMWREIEIQRKTAAMVKEEGERVAWYDGNCMFGGSVKKFRSRVFMYLETEIGGRESVFVCDCGERWCLCDAGALLLRWWRCMIKERERGRC